MLVCQTSLLKSWAFALIEAAVAHLRPEALPDTTVHMLGDVMYDGRVLQEGEAERENPILEQIGLTPGGCVVATVYRPEDRRRMAWRVLRLGDRSDTSGSKPPVPEC
jgi:hypothetical protein